MNFTYEVTKPPDNKFGGPTKDGSWNGMVNELQNGRADIGKYVHTSSGFYTVTHHKLTHLIWLLYKYSTFLSNV